MTRPEFIEHLVAGASRGMLQAGPHASTDDVLSALLTITHRAIKSVAELPGVDHATLRMSVELLLLDCVNPKPVDAHVVPEPTIHEAE